MRADALTARTRTRPWLEPSGRSKARRLPLVLPRVTDDSALLLATLTLIVGLALLFGMVGADARWLAALGHDVTRDGSIPRGVPFAAAPSVHWHNVVVVGEVIFWTLESALGDRGLILAQTLAVGLAFGLLSVDAVRAGAHKRSVASTCLIAALALAPSLAIARAQLFSIALFPGLLFLLRADTRRPSRRIWLAVPLLALWSNLHGAVVLGLAITWTYLALSARRRRPLETLALGVACGLALCANPGGIHAISYYHGVLSNLAAQRGEGLWTPLSPTSPTDVLLILAGILLCVRTRRARLTLWEIVVLVLLAVLTLHAARGGIWLLLMLVPPAAAGARPRAPWRRRTVIIAAAGFTALILGAVRGPAPGDIDHAGIGKAISLARGTPILAPDVEAEQIALAGGKVWASNPIDAFPPRIQLAYLKWLDGDRTALRTLPRAVHVVLVSRGSREAVLMSHAAGYHLVLMHASYSIYERRTAGAGVVQLARRAALPEKQKND